MTWSFLAAIAKKGNTIYKKLYSVLGKKLLMHKHSLPSPSLLLDVFKYYLPEPGLWKLLQLMEGEKRIYTVRNFWYSISLSERGIIYFLWKRNHIFWKQASIMKVILTLKIGYSFESICKFYPTVLYWLNVQTSTLWWNSK